MDKHKFNLNVLLFLASFFPLQGYAQDYHGFICGSVTTVDKHEYAGILRWGKEEIFCDDHFNADKVENSCRKYLSKEEMDNLIKAKKNENSKWDWEFMNLWIDRQSKLSGLRVDHHFGCRFGDIKKMKIMGDGYVELQFKNGEHLKVKGSSNDIGTKIKVWDNIKGEIELNWNQIEQIEFKEVPRITTKFTGVPLFGQVKTLKGEYEGLIQWDQEECLTTDKLDGNIAGAKSSFLFGDIRTIENLGKSARITLKNGKVIELGDHPDVTKGNRGIVVKNPKWGKVLINWSDFVLVTFSDKSIFEIKSLGDYPSPKPISGTVKTLESENFSGKIIYDLDELMDFEMLDGMDEMVNYFIPFRNIRKIKPKNYEYTYIELKSGKKILLGGTQDVTKNNDGILVFIKNNDEPKYIPWDKIDEIVLR